jgi:phytoene dehydrogenase-like protein
MCDRHFGGIHYPVGGVAMIPDALAEGIVEHGGHMVYKANVREIVMDPQSGRATAVRLADGRVFRGKSVVSNATRWDTFEHMVSQSSMPADERAFRCAGQALVVCSHCAILTTPGFALGSQDIPWLLAVSDNRIQEMVAAPEACHGLFLWSTSFGRLFQGVSTDTRSLHVHQVAQSRDLLCVVLENCI